MGLRDANTRNQMRGRGSGLLYGKAGRANRNEREFIVRIARSPAKTSGTGDASAPSQGIDEPGAVAMRI